LKREMLRTTTANLTESSYIYVTVRSVPGKLLLPAILSVFIQLTRFQRIRNLEVFRIPNPLLMSCLVKKKIWPFFTWVL